MYIYPCQFNVFKLIEIVVFKYTLRVFDHSQRKFFLSTYYGQESCIIITGVSLLDVLRVKIKYNEN